MDVARLLLVIVWGVAAPVRDGGALKLRHARPTDLRSIAELLAAPAESHAEIGGGLFDWGALPEVERWCGVLPPRLVPSSEHMFAVICDEKEAIVGCVELGMMPIPAEAATVAYIGNVAVDSAQRRRGVATRLVGFAIKWARSQWRREDVFTHVEHSNAAARALYASLGFAAHTTLDSSSERASDAPALSAADGIANPSGTAGDNGQLDHQVLLVRRGRAPSSLE